jgi:excisionase family DNA binding protein
MTASETPLSDVRFLTVAEVATIMRVSKMTVYRLVHSGELEAIRVGRSFRVPEQAVNQYLREAFVGTGWPAARRKALSGRAAACPTRALRKHWRDLPGLSRGGAAGAVAFYTGSMSSRPRRAGTMAWPSSIQSSEGSAVGSVIKKRRKRMAKKKHRKLLKKTRIQRRNKK